ncbi:MAG: aminotransferase class V-fold PLP-dependent enzyme [Polyangiaceae bacterium]|nr:aminotransferase class V-fold PLP-dependent enzyme [Polyangiaceae bacterium]
MSRDPRRSSTAPDAPPPPPRLGSRDAFPDLDADVYLAHAAISPASSYVRAAVAQVLHDYARRGVEAFGPWNEQRSRLRANLAQLIGAHAEDVALEPNTTRGLGDVALAIDWRRGERIVGFAGEFPTNVSPWQRAAQTFDLDLVLLPLTPWHESSEAGLDALERELSRGARLVTVSAVQFQTGLRMPLGRIGALCERYGAELAVDAIQACGATPIDVEADRIDYLACGGHKWLMGLEGSGFLWARQARAARLVPRTTGWLSHEGALKMLLEGPGHLAYDLPLLRSARVFEGGALGAMSFAALGASVTALLGLGVSAIRAHLDLYLDRLERGLVARGWRSLRSADAERRSGILAVLPPHGVDAVTTQRELAVRGVVCSVPDGHLRFAPHWPNSLDEVERVLRHLDRV